MLTEERITELARLAFKLSGYEVSKLPDGRVGVKCPPRVAQLMTTFQQLLTGELASEPPKAP